MLQNGRAMYVFISHITLQDFPMLLMAMGISNQVLTDTPCQKIDIIFFILRIRFPGSQYKLC